MTSFADMPTGTRTGWIRWARSHDWGTPPGCRAPWFDADTGELVTYAGEFDGRGGYAIAEARHRTPRALKAWAGY
jgi:hypothetical protein